MTHIIQEAIKEHGFLIMAHRGFWGGNIVQNTKESAQLAFLAGADVIELDIARNRDGEYYLFHTGYEKYILGIDKPFEHISNQELQEKYLINSIGGESDYHLNKLSDYLAWFPRDKFINIDRAWSYWDDPKFYQIVEESGLVENIFIKCRMKPENLSYLSALNQMKSKIPFMPIIESQAEYAQALEYTQIRHVGVELIIQEEDSDLLDPHFLEKLISQNALIVTDGERLSRHCPYFLGKEDDYSLLTERNEGWRQMVELGGNIIETDWPNFVNEFRKTIVRKDNNDDNRTFWQ